eukprot:TRINITY_DN1477_c0_g1_i10.p1 TRINITY_DN1477_c0_g1~~TRINITY_DN1477_c0_g1_i10.p1  ORF type:complete len:288 (+),score=33.43 TRINITY_DN1477_c0_g1_i10:1201-2064(+)
MGLVDLGCALFQVSGLEFLEAEAASPEMEQKKKDNGGGFLGLRSTASGSQTCDNVSGFVSPSVNGLGLTDPSQKSEQKGAEDCNIELKLGKRAFYGVAVKPAPGQQASSSAVSCAQNQSKKSRALAHVSQTPKCQVEGCDKELSSAKDYHKRHKVCEAHSKTPQVRVNGIDQRFCQQCSRFHELKEFDEGKRSCRRRLKGHNERRRKPQPFPTGLNPARLPFALPGITTCCLLPLCFKTTLVTQILFSTAQTAWKTVGVFSVNKIHKTSSNMLLKLRFRRPHFCNLF